MEMLARERRPGELYGLHWGDPEANPVLRRVVERFIKPHVGRDKVLLEIGPGGGRWTRYLIDNCKTLYAVDYHRELLDVLHENFNHPHIVDIVNSGCDFPGVPAKEVDFLFTFGVFVHLDLDIIEQYLENMRAILKPDARVFIQYSDKTKPEGKANPGFSVNTPAVMRGLVKEKGYTILEEDTESLWHSSIVLFRP
ncbi:MAG: class I SAM-dependent methyltransferase [Hyphomonadaceae bacterium]|nr:class I SAM-dependent methyltransferase [Hyphomonadaceae bacterium]